MKFFKVQMIFVLITYVYIGFWKNFLNEFSCCLKGIKSSLEFVGFVTYLDPHLKQLGTPEQLQFEKGFSLAKITLFTFLKSSSNVNLSKKL